MDLAQAIVVAMEKADPPGKSAWSVEPVAAELCAFDSSSCAERASHRSSFYQAWVRPESREHAHARYEKMAERIARLIGDRKNAAYEAAKLVGISVNESGLREDVEMGRVSTKAEEKAGLRGAGRGPSGEVCVMQILPSMARKYGSLESFLGDSDQALDRCFRAGLDQLDDSARNCPLSKRKIHGPVSYPPVPELYAIVSRYGNGNSCTSSNGGKTELRVHTIEWMTVVIREAMRS